MNDPKRAEPANEHAKRLRVVAMELDTPHLAGECNAAAAEIERLAARVRELERPSYDVNELRGKIVSSVNDDPIGSQRVHDLLAAIHGFAESKPDQETKPSVQHTCGLPWTISKPRGLGDPPCPACAPPLAEYQAMPQETKGER